MRQDGFVTLRTPTKGERKGFGREGKREMGEEGMEIRKGRKE